MSLHGPLGSQVEYPEQYSPEVLHPIPRLDGRSRLNLQGDLPFVGVDIWNAYEMSWLNERGKPLVACGEFHFPADSPNIIESKSFKLYLNSFNQGRWASTDAVQKTLQNDLSAACGAAGGEGGLWSASDSGGAHRVSWSAAPTPHGCLTTHRRQHQHACSAVCCSESTSCAALRPVPPAAVPAAPPVPSAASASAGVPFDRSSRSSRAFSCLSCTS